MLGICIRPLSMEERGGIEKPVLSCGQHGQKAFALLGLAGAAPKNSLQMPQSHHEG